MARKKKEVIEDPVEEVQAVDSIEEVVAEKPQPKKQEKPKGDSVSTLKKFDKFLK